jgi:hypothetical protein
MRTAIFVYKPTPINISTYESGLQLCGMDAGMVPLLEGENARTINPGIYKIVSSAEVQVTGDTSTFDVVITANDKDNDPTLTPLRATESFAPLDTSALQAFLVVPDAKVIANP